MESSQKTVTEVSQQAVPLGSSVLSEIAGEVERKVLCAVGSGSAE